MCNTPDEVEAFAKMIEGELAKCSVVGRAMDIAFGAIAAPKDDPNRCTVCGRVRPDLCSLCSDGIKNAQYWRTYRPNPTGE